MNENTTQTAHRLTEAQLVAKGHTHIVPGTLRWDAKDVKQKVTIRTRGVNGIADGNTREIATSDLHQCFWTVEVKDELDRLKRNAKAKAKRARNRAAAPATPSTPATDGGVAALEAELANAPDPSEMSIEEMEAEIARLDKV